MWAVAVVKLMGPGRMFKLIVGSVALLALGGGFAVIFLISAVGGATSTAAAPITPCATITPAADQAPTSLAAAPDGTSPLTPSSGTATAWTAEQLTNAKIIVARGQAAQVGVNGVIAALMAAMQESSLRNLAGGDRDSGGLFQQRPSQGWGTREQITDPVKASDAFYGVAEHTSNPGVTDIPNWQNLPLGVLVQAVQRSAYPTLYDRHEPDARALAQQLLSGDIPGLDCTGTSGPPVVSGSWAHPLSPAPYVKVSPFGMRFDPVNGTWSMHRGQDMAVPVGTPDRAACDGVVEKINPADPYGGGMQTDLNCGGGIVLKYMHQSSFRVVQGQTVKAGDVIGTTGTTGHSTGPHLHFQVNRNGTAIDPVEFMRIRGIGL